MAGGKRKKDSIHETPDVSYITNPDVMHEESDVAVGPIAKFVLALGIFFAVVCLLMLLLFTLFERRAKEAELDPSPLARQGEERLPPEPRLQIAPGFGVTMPDGRRVNLSNDESKKLQQPQPQSEYWVVRDIWNRQLNSYEWIDQSAGAVRIPIERAKALYLQRQQQKQTGQPGAGPPTQQQQAQPRPSPEQLPADSSSGHTTEQKHQ